MAVDRIWSIQVSTIQHLLNVLWIPPEPLSFSSSLTAVYAIGQTVFMNLTFWDLHIWPSVFTKATLAPAGTFSPARPTLQNFFSSSMYVCPELNTRLLVAFLFATEALETDNCIKQWNEKHKGPIFGALLILIADSVRRVVCSSFFLLLFSWTDESWGFDGRTSSRTSSADQEKQQSKCLFTD